MVLMAPVTSSVLLVAPDRMGLTEVMVKTVPIQRLVMKEDRSLLAKAAMVAPVAVLAPVALAGLIPLALTASREYRVMRVFQVFFCHRRYPTPGRTTLS